MDRGRHVLIPAVSGGSLVKMLESDMYLYVALDKGRYWVWTGPACEACSVAGDIIKRCEQHLAVCYVARQLRMI